VSYPYDDGRQQRQRRPGSGLPIRFIIAAGLALFAFIGYYLKTDVNEITGETQRVAMSEAQEIQLGLNSAPKMAAQMGGAIDPRRSPEAGVVARMGRQLVEANPKVSGSVYGRHFRFFLLNDSRTVNAFALPGGQIFITRALYDRLENEAQLAGVLGHEIGHVVHRHSAQQMAKGQLGQQIVGAIGMGGAGDSQGMLAAQAAAMANQMLQLRYGRDDELESDLWGLQTMELAGYDPAEMVNVMRILKEASGGGGRGPDILATHPDPDARVDAIKAYLQKRFPNGQRAGLTSGGPLR
jgi:predicted Zn-dependent protease